MGSRLRQLDYMGVGARDILLGLMLVVLGGR